MTEKRMKSDQVRVNWAEVIQHVRQGDTVIVEHYNKPVATIAPYEEPAVSNVQRIAEQVMKSLDDNPHFDVVAIVEEISDKYGFDIASIDDIPSEEYWAIVETHENTSE